MKFLNKIGCVVIAVVLSLAVGCSNRTEQEPIAEQMGRFVETDITPPEAAVSGSSHLVKALGIFPHADGSLDYFAVETIQGEKRTLSLLHCRSLDGGTTWQNQPIDWYNTIFAQYGTENRNFIMGVTMDESNAIFVIILNQERQFRLFKISDGIPSEIKISDWHEPTFYENMSNFVPKSFTSLSDHRIGLVFSGGSTSRALIYDTIDGQLLHQADIGREPILFQNEQYVRLNFHQDDQKYYLSSFDYDNNESPGAVPLSYSEVESSILSVGTQQSIFIASSIGVDHLVKDGSIVETVLDGSKFTFGSPSTQLLDFKYSVLDNSFYTLLQDKKQSAEKVLRYTFDKNMPTGVTEQILIFALRDSDTLRQTISNHQVKYPTQKIELQIGLPEGTAVTQDDAIRILNAELLAGRGPDVLILDGLPIESYVSKGVLSNLNELANDDTYFSNITRAFAKNDNVSAIPARFIVPLLAGNPEMLENMKSLPQIADIAMISPEPTDSEISLPENQRPLFYLNAYADPIRLFYSTYVGVLIKSDGTINTNTLSELLSYTKNFCDKYPPTDLYGNDIAEGMSSMDINRQILSFSPMDLYGEQTQLGISNATGFDNFVIWADSVPTENGQKFISPNMYMTPLCGPSDDVFIPSIIAGINISSKNQGSAKQFIETLLSEEVQSPDYREGFPVNKAAFAAGLTKTIEMGRVSYAVDVEEMFAALKTPVTVDEIILEAILGEAKLYYTGEQSLESAVQNIVKKTRTYLTEKS